MSNKYKNINDELTSTKNELEEIRESYNPYANDLNAKLEKDNKSLEEKIKEQDSPNKKLKRQSCKFRTK